MRQGHARTYDHTSNGESITDDMIEKFADEAGRGYTPEQLQNRYRGPGRPPLGSDAKTVESVRLDPDTKRALAQRAEHDGTSVSETIRHAIDNYLKAS